MSDFPILIGADDAGVALLDVIIAAGGSIQGHPDGTEAGGRAMQAAIADAVRVTRARPARPSVAGEGAAVVAGAAGGSGAGR